MADDWSADLPGFDSRDPSTWHPMHATVASPMQRAARMLDVRLGANLAPATEHIARTLFPTEQEAVRRAREHYEQAKADARQQLAELERDTAARRAATPPTDRDEVPHV